MVRAMDQFVIPLYWFAIAFCFVFFIFVLFLISPALEFLSPFLNVQSYSINLAKAIDIGLLVYLLILYALAFLLAWVAPIDPRFLGVFIFVFILFLALCKIILPNLIDSIFKTGLFENVFVYMPITQFILNHLLEVIAALGFVVALGYLKRI